MRYPRQERLQRTLMFEPQVHGLRRARFIEDVPHVDDVASVSTRPDVRASWPSGPTSARTTRRSRE